MAHYFLSFFKNVLLSQNQQIEIEKEGHFDIIQPFCDTSESPPWISSIDLFSFNGPRFSLCHSGTE